MYRVSLSYELLSNYFPVKCFFSHPNSTESLPLRGSSTVCRPSTVVGTRTLPFLLFVNIFRSFQMSTSFPDGSLGTTVGCRVVFPTDPLFMGLVKGGRENRERPWRVIELISSVVSRSLGPPKSGIYGRRTLGLVPSLTWTSPSSSCLL